MYKYQRVDEILGDVASWFLVVYEHSVWFPQQQHSLVCRRDVISNFGIVWFNFLLYYTNPNVRNNIVP